MLAGLAPFHPRSTSTALVYSRPLHFLRALHSNQNMATQNLHFLPMFLLSALAIAAAITSKQAAAAAASDVVMEPVVEGMVYCQNCSYIGSWSLTAARPIPSAKVSVVCKDHEGRVSFYKAVRADENGYFYGQLKGYKIQNSYLDHPLQACTVNLVSSPDPNCNLVSNINHGIDGAAFRYERKTMSGENYAAVIYAAGPLSFRPSYCPPTPH